MKGSVYLWFLLALTIGLGGMWWFGGFSKTNDLVMSFKNSFNKTKGKGVISFESLLSTVKDKSLVNEITKETKNVLQNIASFPKEIFNQAKESFTNSLIESAKEQTSKVIDSFEEQIGLKSVVSPVNQPPLMVALITGRNKPLYFFIEAQDGDNNYTIDWGDNERVIGNLKFAEKKTIDHAWANSGSYLMNAELTNSKGIRKFSFPIIVVE